MFFHDMHVIQKENIFLIDTRYLVCIMVSSIFILKVFGYINCTFLVSR